MLCKIFFSFPPMARAVQYNLEVSLEENSGIPLPMFLRVFLLQAFWGITEKESFFKEEKKS